MILAQNSFVVVENTFFCDFGRKYDFAVFFLHKI